jgi:hypothetical protein
MYAQCVGILFFFLSIVNNDYYNMYIVQQFECECIQSNDKTTCNYCRHLHYYSISCACIYELQTVSTPATRDASREHIAYNCTCTRIKLERRVGCIRN